MNRGERTQSTSGGKGSNYGSFEGRSKARALMTASQRSNCWKGCREICCPSFQRGVVVSISLCLCSIQTVLLKEKYLMIGDYRSTDVLWVSRAKPFPHAYMRSPPFCHSEFRRVISSIVFSLSKSDLPAGLNCVTAYNHPIWCKDQERTHSLSWGG